MIPGLASYLPVTTWAAGRRPTCQPLFLNHCLISPAPSGSGGVRWSRAATQLRCARAERHTCRTDKPNALAHAPPWWLRLGLCQREAGATAGSGTAVRSAVPTAALLLPRSLIASLPRGPFQGEAFIALLGPAKKSTTAHSRTPARRTNSGRVPQREAPTGVWATAQDTFQKHWNRVYATKAKS